MTPRQTFTRRTSTHPRIGQQQAEPTPAIRLRRDGARAVGTVILIAALAGCSASPSSGVSPTGAAAAAGQAGAPEIAEQPASDAAIGTDQSKVSDQSNVLTTATDQLGADRQVIRTGDIRLEVSDQAAAAGTVRAQATALGGFVANESTGYAQDASIIEPGGESIPTVTAQKGQSVLVLRIPASRFDDAFRQISTVGNELFRSSSAQDVTADVADLTSRTATAKASVERVRTLLAKAGSIQEIVTLESELTRREADLEALSARQKALSGQAALGTMTVVLQTPAARDTGNAFTNGLRAGWQALGSSATALLVFLGAIVPFALVLGSIAWLVWFIVRQFRRRTALPTTLAPTAPNPQNAPTDSDVGADSPADSQRVH